MYTECNWKVWTNFEHKFHIPKQGNMSISSRVRKHWICELQLKEYYTCMMVLRHIFSRAVRDILNNTCHDRGIGRGPTVWPPRSPDLNPLDFYPRRHLNTFVYAAPVDNALWMPVRLSTTVPASLHGCGGPWWDVSRRTLSLMKDGYSTYYNCTLLTIT
jgi:hypothetical protein